jgi:hypothetical protein
MAFSKGVKECGLSEDGRVARVTLATDEGDVTLDFDALTLTLAVQDLAGALAKAQAAHAQCGAAAGAASVPLQVRAAPMPGGSVFVSFLMADQRQQHFALPRADADLLSRQLADALYGKANVVAS